jgi:hypothetical protein
VSLFEIADRLYTAVASLATIGTGGVILVYLARLTGTPEEERGWRWILWASLAWSLAWLSVGILVWAAIPHAATWVAPQHTGLVASIRDTFLAFALGLPGFTMSGVLGRRLVTLGYSRSLIAIAAVGVACVAVVGTGLLASLGTAGIALALTLGHYLAIALMFLQLRKIALRCVS